MAVWDDGSVTGLNGHVDLGTGLRTSLSQIVAEELDVTIDDIHMVLGCTAAAPSQGGTFASASIEVHATPLRKAAAQARAWLISAAADYLHVSAERLSVDNGIVRDKEHGKAVSYGELLTGPAIIKHLDLATPVKPEEDYCIVGKRQPRVDIPAKLSGELVFVHDVRMRGMLHGRVIRPPYVGAEQGDFIGNSLEAVDESSISHIPGIRAVVVIRDFVGVVAEREEHAEQAMRELKVIWKSWPGMQDLSDLSKIENAIRNNPRTQRVLIDEGDVDEALQDEDSTMRRTYLWPYQQHASIGPSCAVAKWLPYGEDAQTKLMVWAAPQNPPVLRADLATLMGLPDYAVDVQRMEAAGCYGRNCADDAAGDAALLSRAVGAPVRVQLTREQESQWDSMGSAQLMDVAGTLSESKGLGAYDFETSYPSNGPAMSALLFTRVIDPPSDVFYLGDRTARPPYDYERLRVKVNDMPPIVRAGWLRGVAALPNVFAHESFIDELATAAGADPVEYRLNHISSDPRAAELIRVTAQKAGWRGRSGPQEKADGGLGPGGDILFGQGFAYARYMHGMWPGSGAAWSAWVADVEVNRKTGEVHVRRIVTGHDAGLMVNPSGVEHQIHGNIIQATSRALLEESRFAPMPDVQMPRNTVAKTENPVATLNASRDFARYPILTFPDVPVVEIVHIQRPGDPPLGVGESASVPGAAAIANAIFDATGVRFRSPPFTPEKVLAALNHSGVPGGEAPTAPPNADGHKDRNIPPQAIFPRRRAMWAAAGALVVGAVGTLASLTGWRSEIAPVQLTRSSSYSAENIERGKALTALGNCMGCHTAVDQTPFAGGRPLETPFGTVFSTNLTPDAETGLGTWSFSAFQRAMREGISQDGRHLYPAFPYTAFAKTSDDDLLAIYAYLQTLPAVNVSTPPAQMQAPFNLRGLMAGWNGLFHDATPWKPEPGESLEWNRGSYLVNGLGHCTSCHTPRNAFGAEKGGKAHLSGALVDGWEAPPLTALSNAAVPWSADELYRYLRTGHAEHHGIAGGPMAEVVRGLENAPDEDVRAMATYLAAFNESTSSEADTALAQQVIARAAATEPMLLGQGQRVFQNACASCHHDGNGPTLLGINRPLALNTNLSSSRPDNLLRTILEGVREPAHRDIGFMPAFANAFSDSELTELITYMRARYAPQEPAWIGLESTVARVRRESATHTASQSAKAIEH
ncbi:Nicotinate dehydrogenase subunit B [Eoetvoesiella caeni]